MIRIICLLFCLCSIAIGDAQAQSNKPLALLVGVELKDLSLLDRRSLAGYQITVRSSLSPEKVKELSEEMRAEIVVVKHSSGIYAYSSDGKLWRQMSPVNTSKERLIASAEQPFPGANIPQYLYPGRSEYSYLPGEGYNNTGAVNTISSGRLALRQFAGLVRNTTYPFWFESYLRTDNSLSNLDTSADFDFPVGSFDTNTTVSPASVTGQWINTGVGVGSTLLDAFLEKRELEARVRQIQSHRRGIPYYYYPLKNPYTSSPPLNYQPNYSPAYR